MRRAFPDALVTGHGPLAASLKSLGPDAHAIAAAVTGHADLWWLDPQAAALGVRPLHH